MIATIERVVYVISTTIFTLNEIATAIIFNMNNILNQ
jgi:hypothetical protein